MALGLFKRWTIFIGHARRSGATQEEIEILCKAADLIRKYSPIKPKEEEKK